MAGKARVYHSVGCTIHGNMTAKGQHYKELAVAAPSSLGVAKRQGCPLCKTARNQAAY